MAKKAKEDVIALQIDKYEKKIAEFQQYLASNPLSQFTQDDRHKEYDTQIKIMNTLPSWLEALKKLKQESEESQLELRGDTELNDVYKHMKKI